MKTVAMLFTATALLAIGGCGRDDEKARTAATVDITADSDTGKMELKLPGGFEAKVDMPGGLSDHAKFDIDGVGLYPGAKLRSVKVDAPGGQGDHDATVVLGFRAPADAAAVADWYQQQFEAKKMAVSRSGETLSGKTDDGDDFTLAVASAEGGSQGTLTIRDLDKS